MFETYYFCKLENLTNEDFGKGVYLFFETVNFEILELLNLKRDLPYAKI